jgi:hypothetical protein
MIVNTLSGTVLDITAGTGLTAGALTSTTGKIDVDSTAGALVVTKATAKAHVHSILQKLCVDDRTQAAVLAMRQGFV